MKKLLLFLFGALCFAQPPSSPRPQPDCCYYVASQSVSLTGSAAVVTVQQPPSPSRNIQFVSAALYSTVATTFTIERDGTVATTTASTSQAVNPNQSPSELNVFTASNVGTGKTVIPYGNAGGYQAVDLSAFIFQPTQKNLNLTLRTASMTGTAVILIVWKEY